MNLKKSTGIFCLLVLMEISQAQTHKETLSGNYLIVVDPKVMVQSRGKWFIQFDTAAHNVTEFLSMESKQNTISVGKIGQPRFVDVTFIRSNDSTIDIFSAYEKKIPKENIKSLRFYCTPGKNTLTIKNGVLVLSNLNSYQKDYKNYTSILKEHVQKHIDPVMADYKAAWKENDSLKIKSLQKKYDEVTSVEFESRLVEYPFIKSHPHSPVSLYVLSLVYSNERQQEADEMLNYLSPEIQKLPTAVHIRQLMKSAQSNTIGKMATDFTLSDTSGNEVALKDFRGKYVLIDFWASWCMPCRAENPNVVKAYNRFKNKNFTIVSISLDENKKNWLSAVKNDQLVWSQLSDLKGWNSQVAKDFAVSSIPINFLLDPEGKIIAQNLRGEILEKTLSDVLP